MAKRRILQFQFRFRMAPEPAGKAVKLSISHEMDREHSGFIDKGVSGGWPKILSNLKSLLETGAVLTDEKFWAAGAGIAR